MRPILVIVEELLDHLHMEMKHNQRQKIIRISSTKVLTRVIKTLAAAVSVSLKNAKLVS